MTWVNAMCCHSLPARSQGLDPRQTNAFGIRFWAAGFGLLLSAMASAREVPEKGPEDVFLGRSHFVTSDGATLPIRSWFPQTRPPRALVIGVHGFNDYGRAFESTGHYFVSQGLGLIAYDQRGFGMAPEMGLWAGQLQYGRDLTALVRAVRRGYPGIPLYLLGQSMGGAVAISAFTLNTPPNVAGVILVAPAVWSRETMPWYQVALLAMTSSLLPDVRVTGGGLKIQASDNLEMLRALGRDPWVIKATRFDTIEGLVGLMDLAQRRVGAIDVRQLILYGEKDQVIPRKPIEEMAFKLKDRSNIRMALYPNGFHMLIRDLRGDIPLDDIISWIDRPDQPLPSGFERALDAVADHRPP